MAAAAAAAADDDGAADLRRGRAGRRAAVGEGTDREDGAAVVVAAVSGLDIPAFAAGEGRSLSHPADHLDREGLASGDDGREAAALRCRSRSDLGRGRPGRRHLRDRLQRPPPDEAAAAAGRRRHRPRSSGSAWPWPRPPPAPPASVAAGLGWTIPHHASGHSVRTPPVLGFLYLPDEKSSGNMGILATVVMGRPLSSSSKKS